MADLIYESSTNVFQRLVTMFQSIEATQCMYSIFSELRIFESEGGVWNLKELKIFLSNLKFLNLSQTEKKRQHFFIDSTTRFQCQEDFCPLSYTVNKWKLTCRIRITGLVSEEAEGQDQATEAGMSASLGQTLLGVGGEVGGVRVTFLLL